MKFQKNIYIVAFAFGLLMSFSSCNGWLKEPSPGKTELPDFFTGGKAAIQCVNAAYTPLAWEYNKTYCSEWFIGDIASDDALKGGQNVADGQPYYDIENFKVNANNELLLDFYRGQYQGIARCNLAIKEIPNVDPDEDMTEARKDCLIGEAYFLRALYYFRLVRIYGGVPLVDFVIDSSEKWQQPRASKEDVYNHIIIDLAKAKDLLWEKSAYADADLGRATRGAAIAMLMKTYLCMHDYANAYKYGKLFMEEENQKQYSLCNRYLDNFTLAGENGVESVFEIQYMAEGTSDYGEGFGFTRGTFTTILVRPRLSSLGGRSGWGFNHPTKNLYDEYEIGDPRREITIGVPSESDLENVEVSYLGNYYYNLKYSYYDWDLKQFPATDHATRSPLNYKLIRLSDVMLMFAEASVETGDNTSAKKMLEDVRSRARQNSDVNNVLPSFPGYNGYADNSDDLRKAIRHERRVELAMEGHRWFDLVRWGIAYEVLDKTNGSYPRTETQEARDEMASFIQGKNELFPLPSEEIHLNPMDQNEGY